MKHLASLVIALSLSLTALAQSVPPQHAVIEVTATKIAEDVMLVPQSVTIVDGADLRARGAHDLPSALSLVAGVSVSAGGDAGPAGSVPEMWGIREADAFLLVVDGVPWGGAFNPDLPTLSLSDVDRVEVVRGAAPVMYGATSFTGVIHVIRREAGAPAHARVSIGTHSSGSAEVTIPMVQKKSFRESITAGYERRGFASDRTGFDRAHLLYRGAADVAGGMLRFDLDATRVLQSPGSPHPRAGRVLSPDVPLDANHNPAGAKLDQDTVRAIVGFETTAPLPWTTTLSVARSRFDILRGFLMEEPEEGANAAGFAQQRRVTDVYFDTHVVMQLAPNARVIAGVDHLYGRGTADNELFDYEVALSGHDAPRFDDANVAEETSIANRRAFSGLYAQTEWSVTPRLRVDVGLRLNHAAEKRAFEDEEGGDGDDRTTTRGSGGIGATWQLLSRGDDAVALFANHRNTFKPAAFDFGPEAEGELLLPETAKSEEIGARGHLFAFDWQVSAFRNELRNLLVSTVRNGHPALENGGTIRVDGADLELARTLGPVRADLAYSYHDARFRDYEQAFDGVPTQLAGHRFEMSPLHLLGVGVQVMPVHGWSAHARVNYTGERYLNKRNTAVADAYTTLAAGIAYEIGRGTLRIDGENLTDERPPVAESELGEAQYYRLNGRTVEVAYEIAF